MTTARQDQDFIAAVISSAALELAIDWIANEMTPEEVFKDDALEAWATDNGFVKEEK